MAGNINGKGLVQVYTGEGKGKTTAALGLAMRAAGWGWRVLIIQFLKGRDTGELHSLARLKPEIEIVQVGSPDFVRTCEEYANEVERARQGLTLAQAAIASGDYQLVILDEALMALSLGLLNLGEVLALVHTKPDSVELVLTGRGAPPQVLAEADLVTCMKEVKHPYQRGIEARQGVDY
ncbi:MAG: cob(I)yrinic acid a,c-diamide adenosyltransferase [Anaerolineae bacterium]